MLSPDGEKLRKAIEDKDLSAVKEYKNAVNEIHEWSGYKGTLLSFALDSKAGDDIINELLTVQKPRIDFTDREGMKPPLYFAHYASKEIHLKVWKKTAPNNELPAGFTTDHLDWIYGNLVKYPTEFKDRWNALNDSERTRVMGPKNNSFFFYKLAEHEKSFFVVWNTLSGIKKKEMAFTHWGSNDSVTGRAAFRGNEEVLKAVLGEVKDDPKLRLEALKGPEGVYGPFHQVTSKKLYDWLVKNYEVSSDMMHEIASKEKYPPLTGIAIREVSVVIALYNAYPDAVKVTNSIGNLPIHQIVFFGILESNGSKDKTSEEREAHFVANWKNLLKTLLQTHRHLQLTATNSDGKTALDIAKRKYSNFPESLYDMLDPNKSPSRRRRSSSSKSSSHKPQPSPPPATAPPSSAVTATVTATATASTSKQPAPPVASSDIKALAERLAAMETELKARKASAEARRKRSTERRRRSSARRKSHERLKDDMKARKASAEARRRRSSTRRKSHERLKATVATLGVRLGNQADLIATIRSNIDKQDSLLKELAEDFLPRAEFHGMSKSFQELLDAQVSKVMAEVRKKEDKDPTLVALRALNPTDDELTVFSRFVSLMEGYARTLIDFRGGLSESKWAKKKADSKHWFSKGVKSIVEIAQKVFKGDPIGGWIVKTLGMGMEAVAEYFVGSDAQEWEDSLSVLEKHCGVADGESALRDYREMGIVLVKLRRGDETIPGDPRYVPVRAADECLKELMRKENNAMGRFAVMQMAIESAFSGQLSHTRLHGEVYKDDPGNPALHGEGVKAMVKREGLRGAAETAQKHERRLGELHDRIEKVEKDMKRIERGLPASGPSKQT